MNEMIWLSSPHMGELEKKYVDEAFDTNWISPVGPHIPAFENELAAYLGENLHVAALQSGTAALHLALLLLNIQPGDEVLCQSFTFAASANPVIYARAVPVFIDSEPDTWNMDPKLLEQAITDRIHKGKKPAAIIVVHLYGMPANMHDILRIAHHYQVPVIEDAAEALGSIYEGKHCGSFGDMSVLSFNGNKIITTSGGGALVSKNENYINQARFLATQARDDAPHYEHSVLGYNYRLSNVCAAIGRGQLTVLPERVLRRRQIYEYYRKELSGLEDIEFVEEPAPEYYSNRWLTTILLKDFEQREKIRKHLALLNIESRPLWKPMHLQPLYRSSICYGNGVSDRLFERGLCLPSGSNLRSEQLEKVVHAVIQGRREKGEGRRVR